MLLKRLFNQKFDLPPPVTESFQGRTILLTGATGGLGLEAAKKIAALNATRLIITARNESKGQAAKKQIQEFVAAQPARDATVKPTEITTMTLDMSSFAGVHRFVDALRDRFPRIDGAILNAGMLGKEYIQTEDGWEQTLQVNALSTVLLGVLLLPLLIAAADANPGAGYKPHLTFVSSGGAWNVKPDQMKVVIASKHPLEEMSARKNFAAGRAGAKATYDQSKLVLEYAVRHLAASPVLEGAEGKPKVIVNTVCPGFCKSGLGRQAADTLFLKLLMWLVFLLIARTAEQGANAYIAAVTRPEDTHGEMWKSSRVYEPGTMVTTEEGREFGDKVWHETVKVILEASPSAKAVLG